MWGPRQPSWAYAGEFGDWIARTQLVLQCGIPRVDIGIYRHKYITVDIKHFGMGEVIFGDSFLATTGYSYVSVSPSLLTTDNAVVEDGLVAPNGPGFSALVVDNSTNITREALDPFFDYAEKGFPIIFVGNVPHESPYYSPSCGDLVQENIDKLLANPSVRFISTEVEMVKTLHQMDVTPSVENNDHCPILYVHRVDQANDVEYYWAFNSDIYSDHTTRIVAKADGICGSAYERMLAPLLLLHPKVFFQNVAVPLIHIDRTNWENLEYVPSRNVTLAKSTSTGPREVHLSDGRLFGSNATEILPATSHLSP